MVNTVKNILIKSELTVGEFIDSEYKSLTKLTVTKFKFELKLNDQIKTFLLTTNEFAAWRQLKKDMPELEADADVFKYLKDGLERIEEEDLLKEKIPSEDEKNFCTKILRYHSDAPLKGYLATNGFFKSSPLKGWEVPSLLSPDYAVSDSKWIVYFLSKKPKSITDEHAMLAYEGLLEKTNQRFFHVAHLTTPNNSEAEVSFKCASSIEELIRYLNKNYNIFEWPNVSQSQVKKIHKEIKYEKENGLAEEYKRFTSSTPENKYVNCMVWVVRKLESCLQVNKLEGNRYIPSWLSQDLTKMRDLEQKQSEQRTSRRF